MSAHEEQSETKAPATSKLRREDTDALWWLARWIGIPLIVVIAIFYSEPLFRGRPTVEIVPTVTRQQVHPYPFPPGVTGPTLAPPEIPRAPRELPPLPPTPVAEAPSSADIVAHPISQPQPEYPQRALEADKEGVVRLRITIAPDGTVVEAMILNAQPKGWFDNAAIAGVKRWRYQPSGRVIQTDVEIEFKLS